MTTRVVSTPFGLRALPGLPRPEIALVAAVAAGAAAGALQAAPSLPVTHTDAVTADLHLAAGRSAPTASTADTAALRDVLAPDTAAATAATGATAALAKGSERAAHTATTEAAIDKFEGVIGTSRYEEYCERAVENAFGTQGHYGSAIADWHARDQHSDWRHAPRGALVFYNTSSNGHVALSLGDGRVVSSSAHHKVGVVPVDYFQRPLGWAPAPY